MDNNVWTVVDLPPGKKAVSSKYALHIVEASKASTVEIPSREVEKVFQITWPNIVCHIEDETSSVSDKKVK